MAFNEVTFGFVPHSGATYYLSRLPHEFGTFLALTGLPIKGIDAAKVKLVDGLLQTTVGQADHLDDVIYSMGYNPREFHLPLSMYHDRKNKMYPANDRLNGIAARNKKNWELDAHPELRAWRTSMRNRDHLELGFEEARDRIPSSVADAEAIY